MSKIFKPEEFQTNKVEIWFQPQYNHFTSDCIGAEVLARYRQASDSLLLPNDFIPKLEKHGNIYELDKYVWEQTAIYLANAIKHNKKLLPLSVNISRFDILQPDVIDHLTDVINRYDIPIDYFRLEIAESIFNESPKDIVKIVNRLIKLGFIVEIDNFGGGSNTMLLLQSLNCQTIKLDLSKLLWNGKLAKNGTILESIIRMLKWLDISVIAEGVETIDIADYLQSIGCNYIQGFMYSKPMPVLEYEKFITNKNIQIKLKETLRKDKLFNDKFWNPASMEILVFNNLICGACIFEYSNNKLELLRANEKFVSQIGGSGLSIKDALKLKWEKYLSSKYKGAFKEAVEKSLATGNEVLGEYLFLGIPGCPEKTYLKMFIRVIASADERYLVYCLNNNVTEQRETEHNEQSITAKLIESNRVHKEEMTIAMAQIGKMICEFDTDSLILSIPSSYAAWYGISTVLKNIPYRISSYFSVSIQTANTLIKFFESIIKGHHSGSCDALMRHIDDSLHWEHFEFISIFNDKGMIVKAIVSIEDVTTQYELKREYDHEIQMRQKLIDDCLIFYQLNHTRGIVEEFVSKYTDLPSMGKNLPINAKMRADILSNIANEHQDLVSQTVFSHALFEGYKKGQTSTSIEYRRIVPNRGLVWVRNTTNTIEKPDTHDIVSFIYVRDIDNEKKKQLASEAVLNEEIEVLALLNLRTNVLRFVKNNMKETIFPLVELPFNQISGFFGNIVEKSELEMVRAFFTVENLISALDTEKFCSLLFKKKLKDGTIKRKRVRASYLDNTKQEIVFSARDITDLYEEEQQQKNDLQKAVDEANKANHAKSDFLSRMSHDMRTPLNAVLAFSDPELTDIATEETLRENVKKIHSSGKYLLGLINDVLDMSKIEQKKIVLTPEPYSQKEFSKTISTIIGELSKNKKIIFNQICNDKDERDILVDKVRFNQIFMNLLSNAVKFTPENGKVVLEINDLPQSSFYRVNKQFIIRDNGIGMSEDFIPHAFESFAQEYRKGISEQNQGTGLGLPIVSEIVKMMNGTISLKSVLNEGTTFTLEFSLPVVQTEQIKTEETVDPNKMKGLKVLMCEDNEMNAEISKTLLTKYGCIVDWAQNGQIGYEMFKSSEVGCYNIILMDIRMPVLDGISAAKAIRELKRSDSKTIPIVAMTADAFTEDEKTSLAAGMNDHVPKPIDPNLLYKVVLRCCNR